MTPDALTLDAMTLDDMTLIARSHPTARPHGTLRPSPSRARAERALAPVLGLSLLVLLTAQGRAQETPATTTPATTTPTAKTPATKTPATQTPRITRTAPPVATTSRQGTVLEVPATIAPATPTPDAVSPAPAPVTQAPAAATVLPTTEAEAKAEAAATGRVESGLLECKGELATGYGFGSSRGITCEFRPASGMNQYYTGTLSRVGLDFGVSDQASMIWMVLATTRQLGPGALAGDYVGFSSGAALGPGFSANVLMAKDATAGIALQPLSVSSDSGLSISFAAAGLTLVPSKAQRH